eukprot:scaffold244661_cov17-Tisochrysis_lutea.AAC.1
MPLYQQPLVPMPALPVCLQPFAQAPAFNPLQAVLHRLNSSKSSTGASTNRSANPASNGSGKGSGLAGEGLEALTVVPPLP